MDSPKLRELTRTQLQALAKREVVRAVGKTEEIIRRLIRKHPKGVPVSEVTNNPSASSAPPKRNVLNEGVPSHSPTREGYTVPKGKAVAEAASPSPSSSSEALEQLLYPEDEPAVGPSDTNFKVTEPEVPTDHPISFSGEPLPVSSSEHPSHLTNNEDEGAHAHVSPPTPEAPNPGWQADEEDELDDDFDDVEYPKGAPNHYMVVDALRKFTTLVNSIPPMETRIIESRRLLQRTKTLLEQATPDARELAVTREYLETFLLGKMKQKRELWDGTGKMNKEDRKLRMKWLRAVRKAENEKRWKETNDLYEKNGLELEPFSAFASESDEEVIESLRTTPTSSGSGGSKRTREESESVGGESDEGGSTDGTNHRKRARL